MISYKNIKSSVCPDAVRFDEKSVWVTENVKELVVEQDGESFTEYEFDQTRYSKDEYLRLIDEKNAMLEAQLTDTQLALCEIYEGEIQVWQKSMQS